MLDTGVATASSLYCRGLAPQVMVLSTSPRELQCLSPVISANSGASCHRLTLLSAALLIVWPYFIFFLFGNNNNKELDSLY